MPNRVNKGPLFLDPEDELAFVCFLYFIIIVPVLIIAVIVYLKMLDYRGWGLKDYGDCFFGTEKCIYYYEERKNDSK